MATGKSPTFSYLNPLLSVFFNAPLMYADVPPSAPNSASDYIATGMIWPYSQLFSSPYFSHQAPPPTTAYPIPIYCPTKP